MKRFRFTAVLLTIGLSVLPAQDQASGRIQAFDPLNPVDFRAVYEFETSLSEIIDRIDDPTFTDRLFNEVVVVFDAVVSDVIVFSPDPADYYAEVEVVTGQWIGLEDVRLDRAIVFIADPALAGRVAERAPRDPDPDLILRNSKILVAGRLYQVFEDTDGNAIPAFEAYQLLRIR